MELSYLINLIFIVALNVLFFFSGICLNSLVILSFWRTVQLRKKLCYFMIMVLSCCDLLAVLTYNPLLTLIAMSWLIKKEDGYPSWGDISLDFSDNFTGFSLLALLVMNFDRYLATYYPLFHRTSVTKKRLLILLGILIFIQVVLSAISFNDVVIPGYVGATIILIIIVPPMLFINYKLFRIARKNRRNNGISPEIKKSFSPKNIPSCLLATACFLMFSIPGTVYIGLSIASVETPMLSDHSKLVGLWARTIATMNSTCNCLIFYWKNKILRKEGMKIIKGMKICRRCRKIRYPVSVPSRK